MPKNSYKDFHKQKAELEVKEHLATARNILELVKICAENSTSWKEFVAMLTDTIKKVDEKIEK